MNKDLTLLIMAGGMGSRFGGLKQIEPVGPNGEFIIDYSIYDAIKSGFNKVVFVIKEENYDIFKETIGKRIEKEIKVEYAFQKLEDIPEVYEVPNREKPLGTAHAIRSARHVINEPFAVINSDDFYGYDSYQQLAQFLNNIPESDKLELAMVGYQVKNTMTENGSVKRGVCEVVDHKLVKITESKVEDKEGVITASPLDGSDMFVIDKDDTVAMNMFGFTPELFDLLEKKIVEFFDNNQDNTETAEFLIPDVIEDGIKENILNMAVLDTTSKWYGVTYKEDKPFVVNAIKDMVKNDEYPEKLWK